MMIQMDSDYPDYSSAVSILSSKSPAGLAVSSQSHAEWLTCQPGQQRQQGTGQAIRSQGPGKIPGKFWKDLGTATVTLAGA